MPRALKFNNLREQIEQMRKRRERERINFNNRPPSANNGYNRRSSSANEKLYPKYYLIYYIRRPNSSAATTSPRYKNDYSNTVKLSEDEKKEEKKIKPNKDTVIVAKPNIINNNNKSEASTINSKENISNIGHDVTQVKSDIEKKINDVKEVKELRPSSAPIHKEDDKKESPITKRKSSFIEKSEICKSKIENYTFGKVLGEGSYGKVSLGIHNLTGQTVAIKVYEKQKFKSANQYRRIKQEIIVMCHCNFPSLIKLFEFFETDKFIYLVIEYAGGGNLCQYVKDRQRLSENEAREIFCQIAQGIAYMHHKNIIHRDVKVFIFIYFSLKIYYLKKKIKNMQN